MIKKCLFPAAGYGTRFLPATKATPKLVTRFEANNQENAKVYEDALINLFNKLQGK